MKCNVTRQSWLQKADLISALCETRAWLQAKPHDCRQNIPWLLWNALLTTPYVSEHFKYMFLVARDLYEMFVLYRGKHMTGAQRLAFEVKYEYIVRQPRTYRGPAACTWASFQTTGAWCDGFSKHWCRRRGCKGATAPPWNPGFHQFTKQCYNMIRPL